MFEMQLSKGVSKLKAGLGGQSFVSPSYLLWGQFLCVPRLFILGPLQQGLWEMLLMLLLPWLLLIVPNCLLSCMDSWPNTLLLKVFAHIFPSLTTEVNGSPDLSTDVSSLDTTDISLFSLQ